MQQQERFTLTVVAVVDLLPAGICVGSLHYFSPPMCNQEDIHYFPTKSLLIMRAIQSAEISRRRSPASFVAAAGLP